MIKRPFFSLRSPKLKYAAAKSTEAVKEIPLPESITLLFGPPNIGSEGLILNIGDEVKTGQRLALTEKGDDYLISTATGTISDISDYTGYLGQTYTSISIKTAGEDVWDGEFKKVGKMFSVENARMFLNSLPGDPDFASILDPETPLNTIVINGVDKDLMVTTNQLVIKSETENLTKGIAYLKKITKADKVIITGSPGLAQAAGTGAESKAIKPVYPGALPEMIMKNILGKIVPAGKSCDEMGVGFINAEAVAALGSAFEKGVIPLDKILTIIKKDKSTVYVKARIGTPVKDILKTLDMETGHGDRIVLGGPMTGHAVYTEDTPVLYDADAIMVQDKDQVALNQDIPCVNCGECVRACPAKIPVNMLVRLLENGLYEDAVDEYDLLSCIECGLCAYVCTAQIPIFHYIMLGKFEFDRIKSAEEANDQQEVAS